MLNGQARGIANPLPDANPSEGQLLKLEALRLSLREMGSVLVAFSGGVDSSFLLHVASTTSAVEVAALTATSPTYLESELKEAEAFVADLNIRDHIVVESNELLIENFAENSPKRCYYCKSELFTLCKGRADKLGLNFVLDGTNTDDLGDYRPGLKAGNELGIISPLTEAGLSKADIRALAKYLGVTTWDKPALACLSSRFPYGTRITQENLDRVRAGESYLRQLGFRQFRLRYHAESARIEVAPDEIERFMEVEIRTAIVTAFKEIGFIYISLDLQGYRSGSMNEVLKI